MPVTKIGITLNNPDAFDQESYNQYIQSNHSPSTPITSEGILEGWESVKETVQSDEYLDTIKQSPLFIAGKDN